MTGMMRQARMTVGRKIYALICLSFIGLLGVAFLGSRELASSLEQQKQIELKHLGEVALGIVKEEHAAAQRAVFRTPTRKSAQWRGSPGCATAATIISGSTTCIRKW